MKRVNKKVILVLLLLIPFMVSAECDKTKHQEYVKLASNITYDNTYSKSAGTFSITVFNIFNGMHVKYGDKTYSPNSDNEVVISGITGGTYVSMDVYANDGCEAIKRINKQEPYYNKYYGSRECVGYEDKLTMCAHQFTSSEVTKSLLDKAIYNYNYNIDQNTDGNNNDGTEASLYTKVKEFLLNWGIKIMLLVVTSVLTWAVCSDKFRKIKHGI